MRDITDWNNCVDTQDEYFDVVQAGFFCVPSTNQFSVLEKVEIWELEKIKIDFYLL